jgi:hypothetical protein
LWTLVVVVAVVWGLNYMGTKDLLVLFGIVAFGFYLDSREIDTRNAERDDGNR